MIIDEEEAEEMGIRDSLANYEYQLKREELQKRLKAIEAYSSGDKLVIVETLLFLLGDPP